MTPESARWLLSAMDGLQVSLGRPDLLQVAQSAAKARAELVAVIEQDGDA